MGKWIRWIVIIVLLAAIVCGGIYYYRNFYNKKEIIVSDIYRFIPTDVAFIIESKYISTLSQRLHQNSNLWSLLTSIPTVSTIDSTILFLDSVFNKHPLFQAQAQKGHVLISFHPSGKTDVRELYIINTGSSISINSIKTLLNDLYKQSVSIEERVYNEQNIYTIRTSDKRFYSTYYATFFSGWLFLSPSSMLIESVIRQSTSNYSLFSNNSFNKIVKTSGQFVDVNIFINHKLFPRIWNKWFAEKYRKILPVKQSFAEWSALDIHVSHNMLLINGFTDQGDSLTNYLKIYTQQEPASITITDILPKETFMYWFFGISNFNTWNEDYEKHLEAYGLLNNRKTNLQQIRKSTGTDFLKLFEQITYQEIALVHTQNTIVNDTLSEYNTFVVMKTANSSTSKELMDSTLSSYARNNNIKEENLKQTIKIDEGYTFDCYVFPSENAFSVIFGKLFSTFRARFFTYIDNYLIFAQSKDALRQFQYANLLKTTLSNDKLYRSYTDVTDGKSNLFFYMDIARSQSYVNNLFCKPVQQTITTNFDVLRQLDAICCQFTYNDNFFYNSIFISYSPEIKETTHTVWESKLDTTIAMKPVFVINHNTQEKEIFVQDKSNMIYLLNNNGRILWKNHIPEQIKSDVYQIDILNNKKLQYVFSTKNYLYVVDRNGDFVAPFPVKLKSSATNGVSVIDINQKNDLRFMIACSDKQIYSYTTKGTTDRNWKFEKTNHFVYQPVKYIKYNNKSYFFFADSLNVYIVNLQGKEAITVKERFPINQFATLYFEPKNKETDARWIINDIFGNIRFIDLQGNVKTLTLDNRKPNHYFLYNDMDGDGYAEFIFVDDGKLMIYKRNKKVMLNYKIPCLPAFKPVYYEFPFAKHKIGLVCNQQLYLIDREGKMPKGFPLKGISPFSISHLQSPVKTYFLITGSESGYLINYEVFR